MKALYEMAVKYYGMQSQIDVAIEEMSELIKALLKTRRVGGGSVSSVAEEIADVEIMLDQLKIVFNCENEVAIYRGAKLARLKDMLTSTISSRENAEKIANLYVREVWQFCDRDTFISRIEDALLSKEREAWNACLDEIKSSLDDLFKNHSTRILHYHDKEGRTTEEDVIHKHRWFSEMKFTIEKLRK